MNLLIFFIVIIVSFIVVRIGAVAFELTGVEWSLAKFQALSCFTGTGFTTKEAELITGHPQRRRIAATLMVLGNAGFVTLIATFATSLQPTMFFNEARIPFLNIKIPNQVMGLINILITAGIVYLIYNFFSKSTFAKKITSAIRSQIVKNELIKPVSFEELVVATGGYGVSSINICSNSPILEKTLLETELTRRDIIVLAIERHGEIIPNPLPTTKFLLGDTLICFGKLETIKKELCVVPPSVEPASV